MKKNRIVGIATLLVLVALLTPKGSSDPSVTGWATAGVKTNPLLNDVLAQTVPLDAGYHRVTAVVSTTAITTLSFSRVNSVGAAITTHSIIMFANSTTTFSTGIPLWANSGDAFVVT